MESNLLNRVLRRVGLAPRGRGVRAKRELLASRSRDYLSSRVITTATRTANANVLTLADVLPILRMEWRRPIELCCNEIDPIGQPTALGQVHRATLLDGREVAIKIRYPGAARMVDRELRHLHDTIPDGARREDYLPFDEFDYEVEAALQDEYAIGCREVRGIVVPNIIAELSTDRVLVSEWQTGATLDEVTSSWTKDERLALTTTMLRSFVHMLFGYGLVHADPDPQNYLFRLVDGKPECVLLDFGSVARVTQVDRILLLRLVLESATDEGDPFDLLIDLGCSAKAVARAATSLPEQLHRLLEPFVTAGTFDATSWQPGNDPAFPTIGATPSFLLTLIRAIRVQIEFAAACGEPVCWSACLAPFLEQYRDELSGMDCFRDCKQLESERRVWLPRLDETSRSEQDFEPVP